MGIKCTISRCRGIKINSEKGSFERKAHTNESENNNQGPIVQNLKKLLTNVTLKFLSGNMANT